MHTGKHQNLDQNISALQRVNAQILKKAIAMWIVMVHARPAVVIFISVKHTIPVVILVLSMHMYLVGRV